jgi:hypothetical protein
MKRYIGLLGILATLLGAAMTADAQEPAKKFGDAAFLRYEGAQDWPTGERAQIIPGWEVPIYLGLPDKRYKVLGRVYDERTSGIGIMTRAFSEGLFSEKDRQRDCAAQAKYRGGDGLLVTNDARVVSALGLGKDEIAKTAPLFQHKDSVVLVIKFE